MAGSPMRYIILHQLLSVALSGCPFGGLPGAFPPLQGRRAATTDIPQPADQWNMTQNPYTQSQTDELVKTNRMLFQIYDESRAQLRPRVLLVQEADYLVLFKGSERKLLPLVVPEVYHYLKNYAHFTLTIYSMLAVHLTFSPGDPLGTADRQKLDDYLNQLRKVPEESAPRVEAYGLDSSVAKDQDQIRSASVSFLEGIQADEYRISPAGFKAYVSPLIPLIIRNADICVKVQIDKMIEVMNDALGALSPEDRKQLKGLVIASPMARRKNLVSQLFARYWGIDNENLEPNTKFFVTENVANEAAALNIADSYMIDRGISQNFFQTDFRMNEDLLSTMTTRYLNSLCPTPGAYCQESSLYGPKAASSGCSNAQNAQMQMSYVDFLVTVIASIALGALGTVALSCWRRGSELLGFTQMELKSETEQNSI